MGKMMGNGQWAMGNKYQNTNLQIFRHFVPTNFFTLPTEKVGNKRTLLGGQKIHNT